VGPQAEIAFFWLAASQGSLPINLARPSLCLCLFVAGCQSLTPRIETTSVNPHSEGALVHGRVDLGDIKEAVYVTLGRPVRVEDSDTGAVWTYELPVASHRDEPARLKGGVVFLITSRSIQKELRAQSEGLPVGIQEVRLTFDGDQLARIERKP
jgi:hypothetical protein